MQRCLAGDTGYGYGRYSQPAGQHRTPAADPKEKTANFPVFSLNPMWDLRELTPGGGRGEEAGVGTRGVTNVEAGASTEIKVKS